MDSQDMDLDLMIEKQRCLDELFPHIALILPDATVTQLDTIKSLIRVAFASGAVAGTNVSAEAVRDVIK